MIVSAREVELGAQGSGSKAYRTVTISPPTILLSCSIVYVHCNSQTPGGVQCMRYLATPHAQNMHS